MWIERRAARCLAMSVDAAAPCAQRRRHGIRPPEQARFMMGRRLCAPVEWTFSGMRANAACRHRELHTGGEPTLNEKAGTSHGCSVRKPPLRRHSRASESFAKVRLLSPWIMKDDARNTTDRPLSHGERVGVRGCGLSIKRTPLPYPSPHGRGDRRRRLLQSSRPRLRGDMLARDDAGGEATQRASGMQPFHPEGSANGRYGTRNSPGVNRDPQLFGKTRECRGRPRPAYAGRPA
jgi:hypothetical protein